MGVPPTIEVANLGMADSLILMVMALVVFGPRRLPQIGRQIGKLMYEFRKASNDFKFQMEEELRNAEDADRRKKEEEERQRQLAANPPAPQLEATTESTAEAAATTDGTYAYSSYGEAAEATYEETTEDRNEVHPTILPPSTGEPVPAAWPANETYEIEPGQEESAATDAETAVPEQLKVIPVATAAPVEVEEKVPAENENAAVENAGEDASKTTEPAHNG
jgi:sec-independent protein translocase protein TatB